MARHLPRVPLPDALHSGARRRFAAVVAIVALVLAGLSSPLAFADDLKDKQRDVKKNIQAAKGELHETSRAMQAAAKELRQAQAQLGTAQAKLAQTRGKLAVAEDRDRKMQAALDQAVRDLERARGELLRGQQEVAEQRLAVGEMVAKVYEQGDPQLVGIASMLEANDPGDMTRSIATNESLVATETNLLDDLHAAEVLLTVQEAKVERKKGEVEVKRQAAAENLKRMQALERQAEAEEQSVRMLVNERARAMAAARRAEARDQRILAGLRAQEDRISAELRRRAAAAARAAARSKRFGATRSDGFLSYPVNGYITSSFGPRTHPLTGGYSYHNGIDFGGTGCGGTIRAAASGVVVQNSYDGAYGYWVIIDHGHQAGTGLATKYNHAPFPFHVSEGQRVRRGQPIGYVGTTGLSTGCHLHFSTLENGVYVDPMNWF